MARKDIVDRIGRLARAVANADRKGDDPGVEKWSIRLADASTSLAVLVNPDLAEPEEFAPIVAPPPNFGASNKISSGLYGDWVSAWFQSSFPEAYRDWPPTVYAVAPGTIAEKAKADGCLAQVCAFGPLGAPDGAWAGMGDWSLFTGLVSTSSEGNFVHNVWIMGKLVASQTGGPDGLPFAIANGLDAG